MKKKLILFLILVLVGFFVCCNEQSNKLEDLLANLEKKDDTNEFEKNKLLWESVIKKVWLKETWNSSETYEDMSFVITRVEKSKLWGAFLKKGILRPDSDLYSEKQNHNMMLTGNVNENRAELTIVDGEKNIGKLYILLEKENMLKIDVQYTEQKRKDTFNFISYNLKDLELDVRAEFDNDIEDVTLKKWGKVKFVSVIRTSMRRKTLFIYLVDDKENILYDFSESVVFPSDFRVNDFLFKDINNDGREDFLLILGGITDLELHKAIIYEQNKIGGFEVNVNKTKKINNKMNETNKYSVWDMFKYLRLSS